MSRLKLRVRLFLIILVIVASGLALQMLQKAHQLANELEASLPILLASDKMPAEIDLKYWQSHFIGSENLDISNASTYSVLTEQNIRVDRISSWIEAVYRLPKWQVESLKITRQDQGIVLSAKIVPLVKAK